MKKIVSLFAVFAILAVFVLPIMPVGATADFSIATFVVNPDTASSYAGYIADIKLTQNLPHGNYIYINFPQGFVLPESISKSFITVNGEEPEKVEVASDILKIYPSDSLASNSEVVVIIKRNAMIKNPSVPGNYGFLIGLSNEANPQSVVVSIKQGISRLKVIVQPDTSNSPAMYLVNFYTSQNGALNGANGDYIAIVFPQNVVFTKDTISPDNVSVNGVAPKSVSVSNNNMNIVLPASLVIPANSFVSVQISQDCGIKNPALPGKYFLSVLTNKDPFLVNTVYEIKGTSIKGLNVSLNPRIQNAVVEIKITFVTSANGNLEKGKDKIFVEFPEGFAFPKTMNFSYITVNGLPVQKGNLSGGVLSLTVPGDIPVGAVNIIISSKFGIKNPAKKGEYVFSVYTSKDLTPQNVTVNIEPSHITAPLVKLSNYGAGAVSGYEIIFYTGAGGALQKDKDYISVEFPAGTEIPGSAISKEKIKVNGLNPNKDAIVSGNDVKVFVPLNISANEKVDLSIGEGAGIVNPKEGGVYTLSVFTSVETTPVFSVGYEVSILPVSYAKVSPSSPNGLNGYYTVHPVVELFAKSPKDPQPAIYYYLDSGTPVVFASKITIPDGSHTLRFYAVDHFGNKEKTVHSLTFKVDTVPPEITIISPVNSIIQGSTATLKGKTEKGASVTINGVPIPVKQDGSFETVISGKGEKVFDIAATDIAGNHSDKKITFTFVSQNATPPNLQIISPQDGTTVYQSKIVVTGKTDRGAEVTINGNSVAVTSDGTFTGTVNLDEGDNTIVIVASKNGAKNTVKITVKYVKSISMKLQIGNKNAIVNGEVVSLDSPPVIINNRTLVPLRFISESFGADVQWDPVLRIVTIVFNDTKIILQIGNKFASVNGKKVVLDSPPQIINGRTMVPIRFVAESFNANVTWDDATKTITITYP